MRGEESVCTLALAQVSTLAWLDADRTGAVRSASISLLIDTTRSRTSVNEYQNLLVFDEVQCVICVLVIVDLSIYNKVNVCEEK